MRNPPLLEHTGTGTFTITNAKTTTRAVTYSVFTAEGVEVAGVDVTGNTITMNDVYGEYYVAYSTDTALRRAVKFVRARITYRTETTTSCSCNLFGAYLWANGGCYSSGAPNCCDDRHSCWGTGVDGSCAVDGTLCCGGSRGQTCSTSSRQVKNAVPSGYTERYGEWVRIENPDGVSTQEVGFSLPKVEWDDRYYQAVEMPTPHPAVDEDGNTLPNVPAWDYTDAYFIHYDLNGDVVWAMDHINNPECFTIVQKALMTDYEMWVSHLPPAYEGTYEFVLSNIDEEFVRVEGNV